MNSRTLQRLAALKLAPEQMAEVAAIIDEIEAAYSNSRNEPAVQDMVAGTEASDIMKGLPPLPDSAAAFHRAVAGALDVAGFRVRVEQPVTKLSEFRGGRIDILAEKNGGHVAIELDTKTPRDRSVRKLRLFPAYRIIGLRGGDFDRDIEGIHEILCLPVRRASKAERSDKTQPLARRR